MASWRPFWRPAGQQASQQAKLSRLVEFFRRNVSEDKIVEFSRVHGSDRRVFSRVCRIVEFSRAREPQETRSSSFLVLKGQIVEFSRARGPDRRVFSRSRARSSSVLVLEGWIVEFSRAQGSARRVFSRSRALVYRRASYKACLLMVCSKAAST